MEALYSLYDALVSINVPNDKARSVVEAMERDMSTTLATKSDLAATSAELRAEIALLRRDMEHEFALVRAEMALLGKSITIWLGSIQLVSMSLLFAALRYT